MFGTRALAVFATAAFAAVSIAPGAMAQAMKPAAAKPATTVSGKIVAIDAPLSMVTLSNGNTYLVKDAAAFKKMKVGATVSLKIAS